MNTDDIIARLRADDRHRVAAETQLKFRYLRHLADGTITNPGSRQIDTLRDYYQKQDGGGHVAQ